MQNCYIAKAYQMPFPNGVKIVGFIHFPGRTKGTDNFSRTHKVVMDYLNAINKYTPKDHFKSPNSIMK